MSFLTVCKQTFCITLLLGVLLNLCVMDFGPQCTDKSHHKKSKRFRRENILSKDLPIYYSNANFTSRKNDNLNDSNFLPSNTSNEIPQQRLPSVIVIGARKCGTGAIRVFLNLHPQVAFADGEPHFFDKQSNYDRGYNKYKNRMPYSTKNQVTIEKTPIYFIREEVPHRIHKMNSSIKLVVAMRDPVQRIVSDYTMQVFTRKSNISIENFIFNVKGHIDPDSELISIGRYAEHIRRWNNLFPIKQFYYLDGENLLHDPHNELVKMEKFLGIKPFFQKNHFFRNKLTGFYCTRIKYSMCLARDKGRPHIPVSDEILQKLEAYYRPHTQKLYSLTKLNYSWILSSLSN